MYSGSLNASYDFDIILNAAKNLKDKNIQFIIRGKGKQLSYLQKQKTEFQINNLIIDSSFVPVERLSSILSKADVLLVPMVKGDSINMSLPTKILEAQAIGRPIISCSSGAIGDYVQTANSGINGMTRALAREFGVYKIRVNSIAPGWIMTNKQKDLWVTPELLDEHIKRQCLKDLLVPDDIVDSVLFLASDSSKIITGQLLAVDGGVVTTG